MAGPFGPDSGNNKLSAIAAGNRIHTHSPIFGSVFLMVLHKTLRFSAVNPFGDLSIAYCGRAFGFLRASAGLRLAGGYDKMIAKPIPVL
jgi:hypothetical protein